MFTNKIFFTNKNFLNLLISLIPLSLILGNLITNINILLVCVFGLTTFKLKIFKINQKIYPYLIYSFFLYLILITLLRNLPNLEVNILYKEHIFKSFFFLRFLIFFLVINKLVEEKCFNIKLFFISCAFFSTILAIDIFIQVSFGKDLLGYPILNARPSGFFGDENIAGGYLQKFSLFFIFFFYFLFHSTENYKTIFFKFLLFIFFFIAIFLAANRMPSFIYLSSIILFVLIEKKFKILFIIFFLLFTTFITVNKYFPEYKKASIRSFYVSSKNIIINSPKLFYFNKIKGKDVEWGSNGYLVTLNSGVQLWKKNKILGSGLKSFRLNCSYGNNQTCNTHPHNYIIELMLDTGLLGFILIYSAFIFAIINFFKFYIKSSNLPTRFITMPFFLIIFFEFFPIRSSGSFFTTNNAVVIFLMLAVLINVSKLDYFETKL